MGVLVETTTAPAALSKFPMALLKTPSGQLKSPNMAQGPPCALAVANACRTISMFLLVIPSECHTQIDIIKRPPGTAACTQRDASRPGEASGLQSSPTTLVEATGMCLGVAMATPADAPSFLMVAGTAWKFHPFPAACAFKSGSQASSQ